jgi:hypothetical protein
MTSHLHSQHGNFGLYALKERLIPLLYFEEKKSFIEINVSLRKC